MRNILILIKNNLRILVIKKPGYSLLMVVIPLIMSVFMSKYLVGSTEGITVGIVDNSKSITSENIIEPIKDSDLFNIVYLQNEVEVENKLIYKEVDIGLVLDNTLEGNIFKGKKEGIKLKGREGEELYKSVSIGISIHLTNLINLANINNGDFLKYEESLKSVDNTSMVISKESLKDNKSDYNLSQTLIGFMIMFSFYRAMTGSGLITEDKEQHIYTRVLVGPIKTWEYFLANIISVILLLIVLFGVSIIGINLLSDANFGMSGFSLFCILSLVAIVSVAIGTFCISVTNNGNLSNMLSNFLLITFLILGGCFIPLRYMSPIINKLSYFTPTRWAMEAITNLQQGADISVILIDIAILSLFSVAFFLAAVYCIGKRDRVDSLR